jgi:hypothetical protein
MYIRTKKLGNQKYAYLVKNKRYKRKKNPRQIVVKYLGKVYSLNKNSSKKEFHKVRGTNWDKYFEDKKSEDILKELLSFELKVHGFKEEENILKLTNLNVNLKSLRVYDTNNKKISLELNEGFLTNYTLKELFDHKNKSNLILLEQGKILANKLVSCGLKINEEIFLRLFEKIHKS